MQIQQNQTVKIDKLTFAYLQIHECSYAAIQYIDLKLCIDINDDTANLQKK